MTRSLIRHDTEFSEEGQARPNLSGMTLVDQLVQWAQLRITEHVLRPGMRMPSIRQMAAERGVSRFTVVEAYERLVAQGWLEARRGAGFFVREAAPRPASLAMPTVQNVPMDVGWLVRSMLHGIPPENSLGFGYLSPALLDGELMRHGLRLVGRVSAGQLTSWGTAQGYLPLRQQLQRRLAELEIGAPPEQIVTTSGSIQAIDLIVRQLLQPGDTVLVGDPAWFSMFGLLGMQGAKVVSLPYGPEGPDVERLEQLAALHRPRLVVLNTVLQNPTGTVLSAARAFRILKLAEQYDFRLIEDDIYADFCPPGLAATRLASLDQLQRVIYISSFSKTLAPNLRVGFMACPPELAGPLTDRKVLTSLTTPEINERVVYQALTEGRYRKHCERLRSALDQAREQSLHALERLALKPFMTPAAGFLGWFDAGCDTSVLAVAGQEAGYLFAPGALFSPSQAPSTWMRCNFTTCNNPDMLRFLAKALERLRG